jgi:hypothetical protein
VPLEILNGCAVDYAIASIPYVINNAETLIYSIIPSSIRERRAVKDTKIDRFVKEKAQANTFQCSIAEAGFRPVVGAVGVVDCRTVQDTG